MLITFPKDNLHNIIFLPGFFSMFDNLVFPRIQISPYVIENILILIDYINVYSMRVIFTLMRQVFQSILLYFSLIFLKIYSVLEIRIIAYNESRAPIFLIETEGVSLAHYRVT